MTNFLKCLIPLLLVLTLRSHFITCESDLLPRKNNDYYQFIDGDFAALPKCCPMKTVLVATGAGMNCTSALGKLKHYEIFTSTIATNETSFFDLCEDIECVDFLINDTSFQLVRIANCETKTIYNRFSDFPKCCPFDYAYDPEERKCVHQNHPVYAFNESLQVINVSLSHCPRNNFAIVDFRDDEFYIHSDKSVTLITAQHIQHGRYCIDKNTKTDKDMIRACVEYEEACETMGKRCVRKCCPDGEIYVIVQGRPLCVPQYGAPFNLTATGRFNYSDADYAIIIPSKGSKYPAAGKHDFYIDGTGYLHILEDSDWIRLSPKDAFYCVEHFQRIEDAPMLFLFLRSTTQQQFKTIKFGLQSTILVFSCILLLVTILCYMFLPEMQNVHGKSITTFCIFMFVGYLTLCVAQLYGGRVLPPPVICTTIGFTILFAFLGAFAWMNVICFDMWMALGMMRVLNLQNKHKDRGKFLLYCLYGCGVPIIIGGFGLIVRQTNCLPDKFVPHIGRVKCYFEKPENSYDYLLYFIVPQSIMIFFNIIFFFKTAHYCYKVKNEIQRMRNSISDGRESNQRSLEDDKEKFIMLVKLFFVMGIPWTFEAIQSIFVLTNSWTLQILVLFIDCFNAAQGIIIFCIFILKKKVWMSIKTRLGMVSARRVSEFSTGITNDITTSTGNGKDHGLAQPVVIQGSHM